MQHQFDVQGMTCGHCERAVTDAVLELDPQAQVVASGAGFLADGDTVTIVAAKPAP